MRLVMMYGLECWAFNKKEESKVKIADENAKMDE